MNVEVITEALNSKKKILVWVTLFLTINGLAGFVCFIAEESMQTMMFGSFAYSEAEDWDGLENHIEYMEYIHRKANLIIKGIGWMAPLMFPAYLTYLETNEAYIKSVKARVKAQK